MFNKLPLSIKRIFNKVVKDLTFEELREFLIYFKLIRKNDLIIIKERPVSKKRGK